jgi:uncharacterized LabA/DUF88 family protein
MSRIVIFLDYANIDRSASDKGVRIDYKAFIDYLTETRFLVEAHCYFPIDPRSPHATDREVEDLWLSGFYVHTKIGSMAGDTFKCNFDVEMTMDMMRVAQQTKPDIIVIASGDSDFVPVILELRRQGVRVEVAAYRENAAREVILKSSGFIDIGQFGAGAAAPLGGAEPERDPEPATAPET